MKVVEFKKEKQTRVTAEDILESSKGLLSEVIVIGVDKHDEDELYLSSNIVNKSEIVFIIEQLKLLLLNGSFDRE